MCCRVNIHVHEHMHAGRDRSAAAGWKAVVIKPAGSINHNAARSHTGTVSCASGLFRTQEIIVSPIEHQSVSFKNEQLFPFFKKEWFPISTIVV